VEMKGLRLVVRWAPHEVLVPWGHSYDLGASHPAGSAGHISW
jgi:hypothetical protein